MLGIASLENKTSGDFPKSYLVMQVQFVFPRALSFRVIRQV